MNTVEILELDARGLPHPEPLERALKIIYRLGPKECFHLVIHRCPKPLLAIAERHGLYFEICEASDKEWHILFAKNSSDTLKKLIKRYCRV